MADGGICGSRDQRGGGGAFPTWRETHGSERKAGAEGLWETEQFGALRLITGAVVSILSNKWSFLVIAGHHGYGPDAKTPLSVVSFGGGGEVWLQRSFGGGLYLCGL